MTRRKVRSMTTTVTCTADDNVAAGVSLGRTSAEFTVGTAVPSSLTLVGIFSNVVGLAAGEASNTSEMEGPCVGVF